MKKRKLLALALVLVMVFSTMNLTVFAEGEVTPLSSFAFTQDNDAKTVTLTKYNNGSGTTVVVPGSYEITDGEGNSLGEYTVILDSTTVFKDNTSITSVTIGAGVKFKDNSTSHLFDKCTALTTLDLTEMDTTGVTDMSYMFANSTKLKEIDVSNFDTSSVVTMAAMFGTTTNLSNLIGYEDWDTSSLENMRHMFNKVAGMERIDLSRWDLSKINLSRYCFQDCMAKEFLFPDSLALMSAGFFNHATGYEGESYTLPVGIKKIGYSHTFYDFGTADFEKFEVADGNTNYVAIDGVLYTADKTELIAMPRGKTFVDGTYEIEEGVTFLPELCFSRNMNLKKVILPDSYELRQYVPLNDPQYVIGEDMGNINDTSSLTLALNVYTDVTDYEVKDTNSRYESVDGILYSEDMTTLLAIPIRYDRVINIPEGVTTWENDAMWENTDEGVVGSLVRSSGVNIPESMINIDNEQIKMLNRLEGKNGTTYGLITGYANSGDSVVVQKTTYTFDFTISVHEDNPYYSTNANGQLIAFGAALSEKSYNYDGTAKTPAVTVGSAGTILTEGTDYTVEYIDNTNIGTAKAVVTGMGTYAGKSVTKTFEIGVDAKIGDTYYTTLAEAITAANAMEGDITITLLRDITFNQMYTINNNITIEGAYTLTRGDAYTGGLFTVNAGKSLNLNNLIVDGNNNWVLNEEAYNEVLTTDNALTNKESTFYTLEQGAPVANADMINVFGTLILNNTTIRNNVVRDRYLINVSDGSFIMNDGASITHCAAIGSALIVSIHNPAYSPEIIINDGATISENYGSITFGPVAYIASNCVMTMNGGEIINNYGACLSGTITVDGREGSSPSFIMNGGKISGNKHRAYIIMAMYGGTFIMYDGEISNNSTYRWSPVSANTAGSVVTIYGGVVANNTHPQYSGAYQVGKGNSNAIVTLYGGEQTFSASSLKSVQALCAPGYTAVGIDEDDDGVVDIYKVIKLLTVEYEDVTPADTEGEKLYNINLVTTEGDTINRLNSVDLTFEFDKENDVSYEIIRSNPEIEINPVENSKTRYEFHYNGKDGVTTDTANKITLGQVRFTGYGKFSFSVDESVDTNIANTTTYVDNIVENFTAVNGLDSSIVEGEDYLNIENTIEDVIKLPLRNLAINITFPNNVEFNPEDYQKMEVKVTGGLVNHTFKLGDVSKAETPDDDTDDITFGPEKSDYTLTKGTVTIPLEAVDGTSEIVTVNAYTLNLKLPLNTTYTVEITGDGYRTARYGVALPEDKTLNFWNNVMDTERVIENGLDSSKVAHNFLAGDIVEDNEINIYDLSAVVSYFAKAITDPAEYEAYVKYDLNRDGVIDSKDVAYVLVSWGN